MDRCTCTNESLCSTAEMNTTLYINYTPIKKIFKCIPPNGMTVTHSQTGNEGKTKNHSCSWGSPEIRHIHCNKTSISEFSAVNSFEKWS